MQTIDLLKSRLAQFDGLSLRHRAGLVAVAAAVMYAVLDLGVIGPNELRSKTLKDNIAAQKTEIESVRSMTKVLSGALAQDPNAQQQAQLDGIKRTIVEVDALLMQFDSAEPQAAGAVLREVLGATPGLELLSLKTLPVVVAYESKSAPVAPARPTPTAAPPGAMYVEAVDAWVSTNARRKPRPGSAIIHGGAKVTRFSSVAATSAAICSQDSCLTTDQTSP